MEPQEWTLNVVPKFSSPEECANGGRRLNDDELFEVVRDRVKCEKGYRASRPSTG